VVVVHGGLWLDAFGRDLMDPVCADLAHRGWLAWNLEYRRVGTGGGPIRFGGSRWAGGGWPGTFTDVAAGIDHLARGLDPDVADLGRVTVLGHSAGGQLAVWAAARPGLPDGAPGAHPEVVIRRVVSLAGVLDLTAAVADPHLLVGGVVGLLGGRPDEVPDRYRLASPVERLPLGIPQLVLHGEHDGTVPPAHSREYARRAREAGDTVDLEVVARTGHMDVIDPRSTAWATVVDWLGQPKLPG
jgi:acetyl esterase/lipase